MSATNPPVNPAQAAAEASMMALAAAQTNPAALDPYGPGDETAAHILSPCFIATITFIVLNTLFLVLRFFTVLRLRKRRIALAWDDWFLVLAYPWVIGVCAISLIIWHYETADGALAHEPIVQAWRMTPMLKTVFALEQIGLPAMILTRYSVLTLYLRLFTDRFVRRVSYVLIVVYTMYWVAYGFAALFECQPVSYFWERFDPTKKGSCWDVKFSRSVSPPNIFFDIVMIVLPLHFIWKLRISTMRKMGLTCIIFTAIGAFIASIGRTITLTKNASELESPASTNDFLLWMVLEPSLYFITACLPAMLPLFRLLVPAGMRRVAKRQLGPLATTTVRSNRGPTTHASDRGFLRLREDTAVQPSSTQAKAGIRESKTSNADVHELENALQMEDLKKFTQGEGIIVQTEVSVSWTTEERIEEILDLW